MSLVRDFPSAEFRNSVLALTATAKHFDLPIILSSSLDDGPNGPLFSALRNLVPDALHVRRMSEINAWENAEFVTTVKATKRKQLIIAGIVTDVCVVMPALSAFAEGYEVFVAIDASGAYSDVVHLRLANARAQLINWAAGGLGTDARLVYG